jgi:hypothetical protein
LRAALVCWSTVLVLPLCAAGDSEWVRGGEAASRDWCAFGAEL